VLFFALVLAEVFFLAADLLAGVDELPARVALPLAACPAAACPATGYTAIIAASTAARHRAERGVDFGEFSTLILPL
jgi:hypothetical protein